MADIALDGRDPTVKLFVFCLTSVFNYLFTYLSIYLSIY